MTFRDARAIFRYWLEAPPENEMLAILASAQIGWKSSKPMTDEERTEAHRESLEVRWRAGAMNAKQIFEAMGGAKAVSMRMDGTLEPAAQIESFPGMH